MPSLTEIAEFVGEWGYFEGEPRAHISLQDDMHLYGDDIHGLMAKYSERYNVDMSSYLWYFHTGEEGFSPGGLFSKPPYARVEEIPITLGMLKRYAESGVWSLSYPEHTLPARRYDIVINQLIATVQLAITILVLVWMLAN